MPTFGKAVTATASVAQAVARPLTLKLGVATETLARLGGPVGGGLGDGLVLGPAPPLLGPANRWSQQTPTPRFANFESQTLKPVSPGVK